MNIYKKGFTLIELMVVMSIIAMMASVVLAATVNARDKGKIGRAHSDLVQIRNAIALMASDTGVWPNGCKVGYIFTSDSAGISNEVPIDSVGEGDSRAGLIIRPSAGTGSGDPACMWTAEQVANWHGPYLIQNLTKDPWGTSYWFDNDYVAHRDCNTVGIDKPGILAVIVSSGPDKIGAPFAPPFANIYGCDDIYVQLY